MRNEARFSVVIPEGALEESMKSNFENMCQRYGIPVESPLKRNSKGQYVAASGLSLAQAQQIRRQISGAGYSVDIQSDSEFVAENDISSIAISLDPDTLVVNNDLIENDRPEEIGDIVDNVWDNLELPAPDADISEAVMLPGVDEDDDFEDRTISVSARQLLDAVLAADRNEKNLSKKGGFSMKAEHGAGQNTDSGHSPVVSGQNVSHSRLEAVDPKRVRHPSGVIPKGISLKNDAALDVATPAKAVSGVSNRFQTPKSGNMAAVGANQLIPPSDIAFEISEVTDAVTDEALAEDQLIDVAAGLEGAKSEKTVASPKQDEKGVTKVGAKPEDKTTVAKRSSVVQPESVSTGVSADEDADPVDEQTVVRFKPSAEFLKAAYDSEARKKDTEEAPKEAPPVKAPEASELPAARKDVVPEVKQASGMTGATWCLLFFALTAAALVILTLIHLYVSPISFIESLTKPF